MASTDPQVIALLTLAYRDLAAPADRLDDLTVAAFVLNRELFTEPTDDAIFEALAEAQDHPELLSTLLPELAPLVPERVEALVHAFWDGDEPPSETWADPFRSRWQKVEDHMILLAGFGFATRPSELRKIACAAYTAATGEETEW